MKMEELETQKQRDWWRRENRDGRIAEEERELNTNGKWKTEQKTEMDEDGGIRGEKVKNWHKERQPHTEGKEMVKQLHKTIKRE